MATRISPSARTCDTPWPRPPGGGGKSQQQRGRAVENGHRVQGNITCGQLPPGEDEEGGATDHGEEHIDNVRIKGGQLFDVDIDRFLSENDPVSLSVRI